MYYKKFVKILTKQGYKINPYDGSVANKVVKGKQVCENYCENHASPKTQKTELSPAREENIHTPQPTLPPK